MSYGLGIDVGTTYTAAAVERDGHVQAFPLETYQIAVPSVVFASAGELLFGAPAARRGAVNPDGLAREFKRRLGDSVPIILSGSPFHADRLVALMANWVVGTVVERVGAPPSSVAVTHPANWTQYQLGLLRHALDDVGMAESVLISEPAAAAWDYAATTVLEPGALVLVYDLGGGTFDVALLRLGEEGFEHQIEPMGIERLGGIDFDEAVFQHALRTVPPDVVKAAHSQPEGLAAVANLKRQCVEAKETLSSNVAADIPVMLPGHTATVRITRREFEEMIRPMVLQTLELVDRTLEKAKIEPPSLSAALLVGGSSRIPLIPQMVAERGLPVRIDAHPKLVVAMGAARRSAALHAQQRRTPKKTVAGGPVAWLRRRGGERPASPEPAPVAEEPPVGAATLADAPEPVMMDDEPVDEPTAATSLSVLDDLEPPADAEVSDLEVVATPGGGRRSTWRRRTPWFIGAAASAVILATIAVVAADDRRGTGNGAEGTVAESVISAPVASGNVTPSATTLSTPSTVAPTTIATTTTTVDTTVATLPPLPPGFQPLEVDLGPMAVSLAVPSEWILVTPDELADPVRRQQVVEQIGPNGGGEQMLAETIDRQRTPHIFSTQGEGANVLIGPYRSVGTPDELSELILAEEAVIIEDRGTDDGVGDGAVWVRYHDQLTPASYGQVMVVESASGSIVTVVKSLHPDEVATISDGIVESLVVRPSQPGATIPVSAPQSGTALRG